jgi:hypothetical protein
VVSILKENWNNEINFIIEARGDNEGNIPENGSEIEL